MDGEIPARRGPSFREGASPRSRGRGAAHRRAGEGLLQASSAVMSAIVNVATALVERARTTPRGEAIVLLRAPYAELRVGDNFDQLNDESDRLARGLAKMGITRGMRTALMVPPSLEFYALTFALFKLGAVVVLIDPGMGVKNLGV